MCIYIEINFHCKVSYILTERSMYYHYKPDKPILKGLADHSLILLQQMDDVLHTIFTNMRVCLIFRNVVLADPASWTVVMK
jgi:hypothetical protein